MYLCFLKMLVLLAYVYVGHLKHALPGGIAELASSAPQEESRECFN